MRQCQFQTAHVWVMTERRTELELEKTTHVPLQTIAEQLLLEVRREREESGKGCLSDDLMSALQFVFHQPLLQALDLLDRNSVSRFVCPAKRELYRVQGSAGRTYTCLVSSNYCSCPSFVYTVLVKEDSLMCKHMLAVQLARAMDAYQEVSISDKEFADLLSSDAPPQQAPMQELH